MSDQESKIPAERLRRSIYLIRGEKVMLDADLAALYGVSTKALNQAVSRNLDRFPDDFMFRLNAEEVVNLKSQIVTSSWGGRRKIPRAFMEHGILMLSSVLRSKRAVQVNVEIMRTFTRLRHELASDSDLASKLEALEKKYDGHFRVVFDAIRMLTSPDTTPKKQRIGFSNKELIP